MLRILLPLLGLLLPLFASGEECLDTVKGRILLHMTPIPIEIAQAMESTPEDVAKLPRTDEVYGRDLKHWAGGQNSQINHAFSLTSAKYILRVTHELKAAQVNEKGVFYWVGTFSVVRNDFIPIFDKSFRYAYSATCEPRLIQSTTTWFDFENGQIRRTVDKGSRHTSKNWNVSKESLRNGGILQIVLSRSLGFATIRNYIADEVFPVVITDEDEEPWFANLKIVQDAPLLKRFNPIAGKIDSLSGFSIQFYPMDVALGKDLLGTLNIYSTAGRFSVGQTVANGSASWNEEISRELWLAEDLLMSHGRIAVNGFREEDFNKDHLLYEIKGTGPQPKIFNAKAYMRVVKESRDRDRWTLRVDVSVPPLPKALPWDAPVKPSDRRFIQESKYIQFAPVVDLVQQVRGRIAGYDRMQAAIEIAKVVNSTITYDYEMFESGLVPFLTTRQILRRKKGMCQQFSVLFSAVARSLGVPVRIVFGQYLESTGGDTHSWVEVKINNDTWWPIDAQNSEGRLRSRRYLPVGLNLYYEGEPRENLYKLVQRDRRMTKWDVWKDVVIEKVN